jgi:hypothetical protein
MTPIELMADNLVRLYGMMEWTLADFSDADMLVRPVPAANHALWQIGHLVLETAEWAAVVPGVKVPEVPADWKDKFGKGASKSDNAKAFPAKAEVMKVFAAVNSALAEGVRRLSPEDLNKPGPEQFKAFAPTVGHLIEMTGAHYMMHVGQFQVIRRKLEKPVLF